MRVGKLKNGKAASGDEITGEMIKGGGDRVLDWIWIELVHVGGVCLEHLSEFKYLGCVLDEAGTKMSECSRKVASGGGWQDLVY